MAAYTITVDPEKRRVVVIGAIPVDHLKGLTSIANSLGATFAFADIGQKLGASLAMGSKRDARAWRAELGIAYAPGEGGAP